MRVWLIGLFVCLSACGYRPLHGGEGEGKLHVVLVRSLIPDAVASDEVAAGAREELAKDGALAPGDGYPRIEIEVLRMDESSEGIARASEGGGFVPRARATASALVARAWVIREPGSSRERDTGDVRASDLAAVTDGTSQDARTDALRHDDTLRGAGRRLGRRLSARILGHPTASEGAMGREP